MKIDSNIFEYALDHLVSKGDTDIFPFPFELKFFKDRKAEVVSELSLIDLSHYSPMSLVESLVPKTKFGFRVAHQPFPVDTLIFTALVCKIVDAVEIARTPIDKNQSFSYRKSLGQNKDFFSPNHTYKDWVDHIESYTFSDEYSHVIKTDISDFYSRIYRHRLENILESMSKDKVTVRKIEKFISDWRGGQSFGLPIGGNAARILAEAALNDTDMALISEGIDHTRYVDDMVLFIKAGKDPYASLAFLARHLSANEGLSLNNQKTKIYSWAEFIASNSDHPAEDDGNKEDYAIERLFWAAYGQDVPDKKALEALVLKDLCKELEESLAEPFWDMGKIRIVLHAMRLVKSQEVASYIRDNMQTLVPFSKDIFLLIENFFVTKVPGFENISAELTELILSPRMQPLDCARSWFLELGVRNIVKFTAAEIRRLDSLTGTLDIRQLHLIRWRANDVNFFRQWKTRVHEIQPWAQPSFIFGARCLPHDEYSHWIKGNRTRLQFPLAKEFADWCLKTHGADPLT